MHSVSACERYFLILPTWVTKVTYLFCNRINFGISSFGCFLVLRKLLFVSFCVVVWVLFSVFSIFCITSLVSATPRNHPSFVKFSTIPPAMGEEIESNSRGMPGPTPLRLNIDRCITKVWRLNCAKAEALTDTIQSMLHRLSTLCCGIYDFFRGVAVLGIFKFPPVIPEELNNAFIKNLLCRAEAF